MSCSFGTHLTIRHSPSFFNKESSEPLLPFNVRKRGLKHHLMLTVMSHFSGSDVFHIFARLSRSIRAELPTAGLLDQEKVIRMKRDASFINLIKKIKYGVSLVDTVDFLFEDKKIENQDRLYFSVISAICSANALG